MRFGILGPLAVTRDDGTLVELGSPKQRAVLALLLVSANRVVALDRLVDELWGDEPPARAAASIQAYVSNLRRALEPDRPPRAPATVLLSRAPGYLIAVDDDRFDVARFSRLASAGRSALADDPAGARRLLGEALALWRGPALADFAYEPFAVTEAARLGELRLAALSDRIDADLALGEHAALVPELERLVADHPLREHLWGQLMLALYRSSRQAEALAAYRRFSDTLADELGLEPGAELRRLEQAILTHDPELDLGAAAAVAAPVAAATTAATSPPPVAAPPAPAEPAVRQYPPPIGREAELARFTTLLERLERGQGGIVLVEGEPGIGKTRLLHTVLDDAAARGFVTALGRCHESGAAPPYWPLTQVGRTLADRLGLGVVAAAAGPWGPHLQPLVADGPGARETGADAAPQFLLAEAIVEALRKLAVGRRLVLALDDVYGADPDSLDVLVRLAAVLPAEPILVIASYRTADLAPDHPLALALGDLSRVAEVERMTLSALSPQGVGELLARESDGPVAAELATSIHARSGGNPFFVIELARLLRAEGEDALAARAVPAGVRDVIRRRLARLPEETRHVLTVAAVAGRDFDLELVTDICGLSDDRALDHLELAMVSQLVGEGRRPGTFRFSHALVREAITETVSALRRARTHRQVADALERRHGADPDRWIGIAHHAAQAVPVTGPAAALPAVTRAARSAVVAQAPELAQRLFDERLALAVALPASPERDGVEMEALLDLLTIWTWTEGFQSQRVDEASARVVELAGRTGQTAPALGAFMARASWLSVSGRHLDNERNSADLDALAAVDDAPMVRFCADFSGGVSALYRGRVDEARARFDATAALVEVLDPGSTGSVMLPPGQQSLASAHHLFRGWAHALAGDAGQARSDLDRGMAIARRADHAFSVAFAAVIDCVASASLHDPLAVEPALAAGLAACRERGFPLQQTWLEAFAAWLALGRGDGSCDALAQIIDALAVMGAACVHTLMRSWLAEHDLAVGRPDAALAELDAAEAFAAERGEGFWLAELARLRALALHALGDRAGAAAALGRAAALAAQGGAGHLAERVAATHLD